PASRRTSSARCKKRKRANSKPLPFLVATAVQRSGWLTSTCWLAAIPLLGYRKHTSFCSTCCAKYPKRACQETSRKGRVTPIFSATARVHDRAAAARSPSNCRFRTWKFYRGSDRSRRQRHPAPRNGWDAFWGQHGIWAWGEGASLTPPTRQVLVR